MKEFFERHDDTTTEGNFQNLLLYSCLCNILFIIVGFIFVLIPDASNRVVGIITGVLFILNGANIAYKYYRRNGAKLYSYNFIIGIISLILGIILIVYPNSLMQFVTLCLGLYLILMGLLNIDYGVWFKIGNADFWLITLVIGVLLIVFGIMLIINPFASLKLTQIVGVFLMIVAGLEFTNTILFRKKVNEIVKLFW